MKNVFVQLFKGSGKLFKLGVVCVLIYDKSEGTFMLE